MKKIIYVALFVGAILFLNIFVYLISPDFRFFLKKIKYSDNIPSDEVIITDDYNKALGNNNFVDCNKYLKECSSLINSSSGTNNINFSSGTESNFSGSTSSSGTSISGNIPAIDIQEFLKKFSFSSFTQKKYDEYYKMFGITDEYVGSYITYTSPDLEIYYFPEGSFDEIYNFFQTLAYDTPISLNRVDNFGTKTFYINGNNNNRDEFIRLVMEYNGKIFGLKIKNIQYNNVKNILKGF